MRRFKGKSKTSFDRYNTMEVSVIGGGLEKYKIFKHLEISPGKFVYVKLKGENHEKMVKFRSWSNARAKKVIEEIRPASREEIKRLLKNMVKGFFWENKIPAKVVDVAPENNGFVNIEFTADTKLDLKKYGPKLSKILHLKARFKQIGARDMAKKLGGIGICGRPICCQNILKELPSVTLEMARAQYLFSAPEKLSGICGRLMCCLRFELPYYQEVAPLLPKLGQVVKTEYGVGKVSEVNALKLYFKVKLENESEAKIEVSKESKNWEPVENKSGGL